jgi:hypothetical protein
MTYDFSFDGKSLWGLLAGSVVLCALLFFVGLLVGVGWNAKPPANATAQGAARDAQAAAQTAAQPAVQPVAAQPAAITVAPRAALPPAQEPALYDDPARQEYAARGYGSSGYGPRDYAPQAGGPAGYGSAGYGSQRYAAQGATAAAPSQSSGAPAPGPYVSGRREAERLSARAVDPDPRLVQEADGAAGEAAGASPRAGASAYSVQVGAYLEEREARRLSEELENKGYTPTVFSGLDAEARKWYAVRIGSYANTKDAGQAANNFERQEKRKTAVRPAGSL